MMDEKLYEQYRKAENLQVNLHCAIEAVRQSWVAMTQGDSAPCELDYDALCGIYNYLSELDGRFLAWVQEYWEALKK